MFFLFNVAIAFAGLFAIQCSIAVAQAPVQLDTKSRGKSFNPDISVNALMFHQESNRGYDPSVQPQNGTTLQEAELLFSADVDPYSKLKATLSIHPEVDTSSIPHRTEYKIEPEEAFVDTLQVPYVSLRLGKFKAAMGKHNLLHTHAFPFIDAPLGNTVLLGSEGINDVGFSAAYLIPGLSWYSEVIAQVLSGRTESTDYLNSRSPGDKLYALHLTNLWDLSEALTFEIGLSGARGKNAFQDAAGEFQGGNSDLHGVDLTFKWRPVKGGKYQAWVWSTEYLNRQISRPLSKNEGRSVASWVQYQFAQRWWAQARTEYLEVKDDAATPLAIDPFQRKHSALIGFLPSEFSGFRLQYSHMQDAKTNPEQMLMLQANFAIGAHPAHAY